jgi:hypothetical protein
LLVSHGQRIWRAEHDPTQFYVLQQSGDRVVFVAMRGVELSGNTLRYSYGGNSSNWELLRIGASDNRALDRLKLEFESERRAVVYVLCDTCSVRGVWLQKVF